MTDTKKEVTSVPQSDKQRQEEEDLALARALQASQNTALPHNNRNRTGDNNRSCVMS